MSDGETWYWVDMRFACGAVIVKGGIVIDCAPIFRKFLMGQPWKPLRRWAWREL